MSTQDTPPKRPRFRVHGVATIKHLNVRKEGPEDEKVLAVDVKLVIDKLPRTVCDYFDEALVPFLWRGDPATDALIVRNAFLRPIAYAHEVSNAFVRIDNGVFHGCDVGKFSLEPRDGGTVDLTCSVAIYPSANDVSDLAKHVQDGVHVAIEGPPDLFNADDNQDECIHKPARHAQQGKAKAHGTHDGRDSRQAT